MKYKKLKTPNLSLVFIIIGFILVADGLISLVTQWNEGFLFNFGRVLRIFLGMFVLSVGFLYNFRISLKMKRLK